MLKLTMISAVDKKKKTLFHITRFVLHCVLLENFSRRVREMILVASGYEACCRLFHNVDLINLKFQRILRPPSRFAHVYINNTNIIGVILTKYWGWINVVVSLNPALPFAKTKIATVPTEPASFVFSGFFWFFFGFFFVSLSLEFVCLCLRPCCYPGTIERD